MLAGVIHRLCLDKEFGFIAVPGLADLVFFHLSQLRGGLTFDESLMGHRVEFDLKYAKNGYRALDVTPATD